MVTAEVTPISLTFSHSDVSDAGQSEGADSVTPVSLVYEGVGPFSSNVALFVV
jgi:hypothetical protein